MSLQHRRLNIWLVALLALLALPIGASAQQTRQATIQANNGQDYAATELGNPWDMDSQSDIAFEYTRDHGNVANLRFEGSRLKATATSAKDPRITILVPSDPNVNPVLPEGGFRPIDAGSYHYLTVKFTSPITSKSQVFWQTTSNQPFGASALGNANVGENIVTFDLSAGGSGTPWSGKIQGLYFDPFNGAGDFELDWIRLSTAPPSQPDNTPPTFTITSPSYISGPDFATTELGNSWDMDGIGDIEQFMNVKNVSFANGILRATNTTSDPEIALNVPGTINTAKYKYVTYRFEVDGKIDTVNGSVARLIWWSTIPQQGTTSRDIVVYEGLRTVSFDMTKLRTEPNAGANTPWLQSAPTYFRFDPHEFPDAHAFSIDYIMLTGDSTANASYDIRYNLSDADGDNANVQWFYDADHNPSNGNTALTCGAAHIAAADQPRSYLPMALGRNGPPVTPDGTTCRWNTANVPNGSYYIYGVVSDGTDSVGRYSETPVIVQH